MILGLDEWHFHEISQFTEIMVPIAYASSEGSDEPVHLRKIVSAFRLNREHRRNVDEGTFINLG